MERKVISLKFEIDLEFAYIPPGEFLMGSPKDEPGRWEDESPQHRVTIQNGFYMQTTPVTQGQYKAITGKNPSRFKDGGPECPVETVSWDDAKAFVESLNRMTGEKFRLPTEAEWEYACRAGTTTPFWTGNCLSTDQANYDGNYLLERCPKGEHRGKTTPVKMFPPNPWGLHDMHGNVWEWVEDDWHDSYNNSPEDGSCRISRGGSWSDFAGGCRSAYRYGSSPGSRRDYDGFRLALPVGPD